MGFLSPPFCLFASVLYTYNSMYIADVHIHIGSYINPSLLEINIHLHIYTSTAATRAGK